MQTFCRQTVRASLSNVHIEVGTTVYVCMNMEGNVECKMGC